jgi:endonuclease/exonuclease/phosphatase (EEP) superfamily protein YafD
MCLLVYWGASDSVGDVKFTYHGYPNLARVNRPSRSTVSVQSMSKGRRQPSIPGFAVVALCVAIVVALPVVAWHVDRSADEFSGSHLPVAVASGWVICALLIALVATRELHLVAPVDEGAGMAIGYDALPVLLIAAWAVVAAALLTHHWLLAVVAGGLCVYHVMLVVPRLISARVPRWARHAPTLDVVVANVYIDNKTPEDAAGQLVAAKADVVVLVESTPAFLAILDGVGGGEAYPHRVTDPDDHSDYAVTLASKHELGPRSRMATIGPLRVAIADIDVAGTSILVVALNPMATVDPGGHETWKEQIEALKEFVPTLSGPLIIAGDLNTTRYRPEFEELLGLGLADAIDSLGKGLNPSFKLGADGVLGTIGAVARLDHALVNDSVHALSVINLEPCGSDHLPFRLKVAIRTVQVSRRARK